MTTLINHEVPIEILPDQAKEIGLIRFRECRLIHRSQLKISL